MIAVKPYERYDLFPSHQHKRWEKNTIQMCIKCFIIILIFNNNLIIIFGYILQLCHLGNNQVVVVSQSLNWPQQSVIVLRTGYPS